MVWNTTAGRIKAVDSDGYLRSCPSGLGWVDGCRGTSRYDRLTDTHRIRVGSWNIGSLTGKLLELGDALGRRKVDRSCFQETKWKGDNVVQVTRNSDRIIAISEVMDGDTVNVISAYAPQVGISDAVKKRFWDALDELVKVCPND
ncbi:craniofacial development protein 2-like protein [Tanacetum coccineum]